MANNGTRIKLCAPCIYDYSINYGFRCALWWSNYGLCCPFLVVQIVPCVVVWLVQLCLRSKNVKDFDFYFVFLPIHYAQFFAMQFRFKMYIVLGVFWWGPEWCSPRSIHTSTHKENLKRWEIQWNTHWLLGPFVVLISLWFGANSLENAWHFRGAKLSFQLLLVGDPD